MELRIAVLQTDPEWAQPARNLARAGDLVASSGADVALLPEMFATGFCEIISPIVPN